LGLSFGNAYVITRYQSVRNQQKTASSSFLLPVFSNFQLVFSLFQTVQPLLWLVKPFFDRLNCFSAGTISFSAGSTFFFFFIQSFFGQFQAPILAKSMDLAGYMAAKPILIRPTSVFNSLITSIKFNEKYIYIYWAYSIKVFLRGKAFESI
jgi:hypothetical protein